MNKKSIIAVLLLLLVAATLLLGLPFTAEQVIEKHTEQPIVVTAPPPLEDEYVDSV